MPSNSKRGRSRSRSGSVSGGRASDGSADAPRTAGKNAKAIVGFGLSLVALVPPVWLGYSFATDYDSWFGGHGLFLDDSAFTLFFVIFLLVPSELVMLVPAFILSRLGAARAKRDNLPYGSFARSGLIISTVATLLVAACVVFSFVNA